MGQQTSRKSNGIYFHQTLLSFLGTKKQCTKPEEPIKFQYKIPNKEAKKHQNKTKNFDSFGFNPINNLKSVLDGVKTECNGLKRCAVADSEDNVNSYAYKLRTVENTVNTHAKFTTEHISTKINNVIKVESKLSSSSNEHKLRLKSEHSNSAARTSHKSKKRIKEHRKEVKTKHVPTRTKSEPNLESIRGREIIRNKRNDGYIEHRVSKIQQFGYEIQDVDAFLAKATLNKPANIPVVLAFPSVLYQTRVGGYQAEISLPLGMVATLNKPANIPVVLAFPSVLYQTRVGGYQAEISLPLGMVVNAIFRNQNWLYVQTPHAEEGYVSYPACLPLGIIHPPNDDKLSPCWEKSTDIFPKPSGNMTDTEKISCKSETEDDTYCPRTRFRTAVSTCGEKSVDRLYLRAAAIAKGKCTIHTLLVINNDYKAVGKDSLSVFKNEVVFLLNASIKGWFYVKNKEGQEGFIPSVIAGHGFL